MSDIESADVRVGQVWADNDKRQIGRKVRVVGVTGDGRAEVVQCDSRGQQIGSRTTFIRLDRFKPTSTGFRLLMDAA